MAQSNTDSFHAFAYKQKRRRQQQQEQEQEQQDRSKAEDTDLIHVERLDKDEYIPNERDDDFEGEDDEDILEINGDALNPDVVGIEEDELPQAANQLPLGFIRNPGTLSFYFFLGIYTGDGFHNQANTIIGIGLKATFFAYMYQLLLFMDVRYGAGTLGGVRWGYADAASARTLFRYGLPSSNILNSQPDLMARLLPLENTLDSLLVFLLGYVCADGTIRRKWGGTPNNILAMYSGLSLYSRDNYLLKWFHNHLLNMALLQPLEKPKGLRDSGVPLDGKMQLLEHMLLNSKQANIFHDYLGACYTAEAPDRTACVIGQDLFDLNLFDLNTLCEFVGFPRQDSTYNFNLEAFVRFVRNIASGPLQTPGHRLVARYFHICEQRVIPNAEIINKEHAQPFHICNRDGCRRWFTRRYEYLNHVQAQHDLIPFECPVEGCDKEFSFPSGLVAHQRLEHGSEPAVYCRHCQKPFENQERLDRHLNKSHNPANTFACQEPNCGYRFSRLDTLAYHMNANHSPQLERKRCPVEGCFFIYTMRTLLLHHFRNFHKMEPSIACPQCRKRFHLQEQLDEHLDAAHNQLTCDQCHDTNLWSPSQMAWHLQRSHNPQNRFVCRCTKRFADNRGLNRHQNLTGHA
ncbi:C2H2-type zinc finger transcription factor [Mucor lusitanicus]